MKVEFRKMRSNKEFMCLIEKEDGKREMVNVALIGTGKRLLYTTNEGALRDAYDHRISTKSSRDEFLKNYKTLVAANDAFLEAVEA